MNMGLSYSVQKRSDLMTYTAFHHSRGSLFCSNNSSLYIILLISQQLIKDSNHIQLLYYKLM